MTLGNITREHTVWCSRCVEWEQQPVHLKSDMVKVIRRGGWGTRQGKWVCPLCIAKERRVSE